MAASIHKGEDEIILRVHDELTRAYPTLLLILVPRHPEDSKNVSQVCQLSSLPFYIWSCLVDEVVGGLYCLSFSFF